MPPLSRRGNCAPIWRAAAPMAEMQAVHLALAARVAPVVIAAAVAMVVVRMLMQHAISEWVSI